MILATKSMVIFLVTLIVTLVCCAALGVGLLFAHKPLSGSCGKRIPGKASCNGCPNKDNNRHCQKKQHEVHES